MKRKVVKMNSNKGERKEAFLGAIIGSVAGIAGGLISEKKKRKAEELTFKQQQDEQFRIDGLKQANALTSSIANQDYVNQYQDKVVLKGGGRVKYKKGQLGDRNTNLKKFRAGGSKKAEAGTEMNFGKEAGDAIGGIAGLATALFTKPKAAKMIKKADGFDFGKPKEAITPNSYQVDQFGNPITGVMNPNAVVDPNNAINPLINNRVGLAKLGKRIKIK